MWPCECARTAAAVAAGGGRLDQFFGPLFTDGPQRSTMTS